MAESNRIRMIEIWNLDGTRDEYHYERGYPELEGWITPIGFSLYLDQHTLVMFSPAQVKKMRIVYLHGKDS